LNFSIPPFLFFIPLIIKLDGVIDFIPYSVIFIPTWYFALSWTIITILVRNEMNSKQTSFVDILFVFMQRKKKNCKYFYSSSILSSFFSFCFFSSSFAWSAFRKGSVPKRVSI
jgi:hypothetical protein